MSNLHTSNIKLVMIPRKTSLIGDSPLQQVHKLLGLLLDTAPIDDVALVQLDDWLEVKGGRKTRLMVTITCKTPDQVIGVRAALQAEGYDQMSPADPLMICVNIPWQWDR